MSKVMMDKEQVAELIVRTFALRGATETKILIIEVLADAERQIEEAKENKNAPSEE